MTGMNVARDTFIKHVETKLNNIIPVKVWQTSQQKLTLDALNLRFMTDKASIGRNVWDMMVSLDIIVTNKATDMSPERKAIDWQEKVLTAVADGRTTQLHKSGSWVNGGYILWAALDNLAFKDVNEDSYIHKNLTLIVKYFVT